MKITPSNELKHIVRILKSCKNELHLQSVIRMFNNFKSKWRDRVDSVEMIEFMFKFETEYKKKKSNL